MPKDTEPLFNCVYYVYGHTAHLVGPPGPKGGKKTLCGRRYSSLEGGYYRSAWGADISNVTERLVRWSWLSRKLCGKCKGLMGKS